MIDVRFNGKTSEIDFRELSGDIDEVAFELAAVTAGAIEAMSSGETLPFLGAMNKIIGLLREVCDEKISRG